MRLPEGRGPLSDALFFYLRGFSRSVPSADLPPTETAESVVHDDDEQIALWALFELHYTGFEDVDDAREWDPALIGLRNALATRMEMALAGLTHATVSRFPRDHEDFGEALRHFIDGFDGPSVARHCRKSATLSQMLEMLMIRSIYNLKEADPHTWVIPRLTGVAKSALASVQYDEYGSGRPGGLHSQLFAESLAAAGLDPRTGAYIDLVPAITLANSNMLSLFGLHRRLRGCAMGHLAAFESTSSLPARDTAAGLRRVGLGRSARYFDEHVEADAVHEQVALRMICGSLAREDPRLVNDMVMGAAACLVMDAAVAHHMLERWHAGVSALRGQVVARAG